MKQWIEQWIFRFNSSLLHISASMDFLYWSQSNQIMDIKDDTRISLFNTESDIEAIIHLKTTADDTLNVRVYGLNVIIHNDVSIKSWYYR